jgi:hypothetical protein
VAPQVEDATPIVTLRFHLRHGDDDGLIAHVHADEGIQGIGVDRLDRLIVRRVEPGVVADGVPVAFVFRVRLVDEVVVLNAMVIDERVAPDDGLLRDGAGFGGSHFGESGAGQRQCGQKNGGDEF